jgi:hypothetical protein
LAAQHKAGGATIQSWDDPAWQTWKPTKTFNPSIRFGELRVDLKQITDHYPRTLQLAPAASPSPRRSRFRATRR